jgi:ferric-dicitrate binding protein FerR (iron transport regulator)
MERNEELKELRSEEAFAELLGKSPPRPNPPVEDEVLIRAAVHAEWRQLTAGHVRRRQFTSYALAASVVLAVFATLNLLRDPVVNLGDLQMASVDKQFGDISVNSRIANAGQLAAINGGDLIETGSASGLALGWHDGGSLRLDENTTVVFEAANQIYLEDGRIYFDSQSSPLSSQATTSGAANLSIRTDHGMVRHLGTQYMTAVADDELVISVREGVVSVDGNVTARASAGQQFAISGSGALKINDTNGIDDWEWVEKSTPAVDLAGRRIAEALEWVSRESGRAIQYASAEAESLAQTERFKGDFNVDVPPSRKLELFMMTVDLNARIEGEVIVVSED